MGGREISIGAKKKKPGRSPYVVCFVDSGRPTGQPTDKAAYRVACTRQKKKERKRKKIIKLEIVLL